jgi:hypothetical protein
VPPPALAFLSLALPLFLSLSLLLLPLTTTILLPLAIALFGASNGALLYWSVIVRNGSTPSVTNWFSGVTLRIGSRVVRMGDFVSECVGRSIIAVSLTFINSDDPAT